MITGKPENLKWLREQLEKSFQVKTQLLGPGEQYMQQAKILNKVITWHPKKNINYETDPRHVEITGQQLKLESAKSVATPSTKEEGRTADNQDEPLGEEQTTKYRALVARCNYLNPDRPDIACSVKELARNKSTPRQGGLVKVEKTRAISNRTTTTTTMV